MLLAEQRAQRLDLTSLLRVTNQILNNLNINNQAKRYFHEKLDDDMEHIPEEDL